MSRSNVQAQQVKVGPAKPASAFRNQNSANVQTEIGRAFEVASAIEKALRAEAAETLERFVTRALAALLERGGEDCIRIAPVADWLTPLCLHPDYHLIQIYTKPSDTTQGGKTIGISMPSLPSSEFGSAQECMQHFGFAPGQISASTTEDRDMRGLDIGVVAGLVCCLLRRIPKITAKNEILCWFDHAKEGKLVKRALHSAEELDDCLKSIFIHEPLRVECVVLSENGDDALLAVCRLPFKKIRLQLYDLVPKKRSRIREMLKLSGFIWRNDQSASGETQDWSGPENPELLIATVRQILDVRGAGLESNTLQIGLHWPPFFD